MKNLILLFTLFVGLFSTAQVTNADRFIFKTEFSKGGRQYVHHIAVQELAQNSISFRDSRFADNSDCIEITNQDKDLWLIDNPHITDPTFDLRIETSARFATYDVYRTVPHDNFWFQFQDHRFTDSAGNPRGEGILDITDGYDNAVEVGLDVLECVPEYTYTIQIVGPWFYAAVRDGDGELVWYEPFRDSEVAEEMAQANIAARLDGTFSEQEYVVNPPISLPETITPDPEVVVTTHQSVDHVGYYYRISDMYLSSGRYFVRTFTPDGHNVDTTGYHTAYSWSTATRTHHTTFHNTVEDAMAAAEAGIAIHAANN